MKRTVIEEIAAHKEAKTALNAVLRKENEIKERYLGEHGTLVGASEALEAIENEIDTALSTERDALLGVFQAATTLQEVIVGVKYLHELVLAGDTVMEDHGAELPEWIVEALERIAASTP